jgi:hypothetical protein
MRPSQHTALLASPPAQRPPPPLPAAPPHQYCAPTHCSACRAPSRSAASVGSSLCVAVWRMSTSSRDSPAASASPDTDAASLPFCSESVTPLTSLRGAAATGFGGGEEGVGTGWRLRGSGQKQWPPRWRERCLHPPPPPTSRGPRSTAAAAAAPTARATAPQPGPAPAGPPRPRAAAAGTRGRRPLPRAGSRSRRRRRARAPARATRRPAAGSERGPA